MTKARFESTYDKALAEGSKKQVFKIAEKMLIANEPVEKIEEYTELKLADIKPIAESLGISLVITI